MAELNGSSNSYFLTLTFDDKNLRKFGKYPNKAVRLFLDRLRKCYGKGIRHFIKGEHGEKTGRFHYHGLLFNCPTIDPDRLSKLWKYGFIKLGWCNKKTINYVIKYMTKDAENTNSLVKIPRIIASNGIGKRFVEINQNEPMKTMLKPYLTLNNGGKLKLPRYIQDKMYDIEDKIIMKILNSEKPFERYLDGIKYTNEDEFLQKRKEKFQKNVSLGLSRERDKPHFVHTNISPIHVDYDDPFDNRILNLEEYLNKQSDFSLIEDNPF